MLVKNQKNHHASKAIPVGAIGFVLLNSAFRFLYVNDEAMKIIEYPDGQKTADGFEKVIVNVIQSAISKKSGAFPQPALAWITSGRRKYSCRLFSVSPLSDDREQPSTAIVIERNSVPSPLFAMAEEFKLTQRESEAVQHLMLGLTSKEISVRMGISPNTVKAFLRLMMIKTGVTTRSGIIGKLLKSA